MLLVPAVPLTVNVYVPGRTPSPPVPPAEQVAMISTKSASAPAVSQRPYPESSHEEDRRGRQMNAAAIRIRPRADRR
jgi:hypothetical protein